MIQELGRTRRKAAGFSQEELAFRCDLSMSYISFLETRNRQPTLTVIEALAQGLGVTFSDFAKEIEVAYQRRRDAKHARQH